MLVVIEKLSTKIKAAGPGILNTPKINVARNPVTPKIWIMSHGYGATMVPRPTKNAMENAIRSIFFILVTYVSLKT